MITIDFNWILIRETIDQSKKGALVIFNLCTYDIDRIKNMADLVFKGTGARIIIQYKDFEEEMVFGDDILVLICDYAQKDYCLKYRNVPNNPTYCYVKCNHIDHDKKYCRYRQLRSIDDLYISEDILIISEKYFNKKAKSSKIISSILEDHLFVPVYIQENTKSIMKEIFEKEKIVLVYKTMKDLIKFIYENKDRQSKQRVLISLFCSE